MITRIKPVDGAVLQLHPDEVLIFPNRFAHLSKGKAWGKRYKSEMDRMLDTNFEWCRVYKREVLINQAGFYVVEISDGFNRSERFDLIVEVLK